MKKKGFTLIELIVVIAIIGVLAAILVPAMLGYVKKSKVTTANTTAKSIYNALNSALTDMDTEDISIRQFNDSTSGLDGSDWKTVAEGNGTDPTDTFQRKTYNYFTDLAKVHNFGYVIREGGCIAAAALNGIYPGSYPKPMTVDEYNDSYSDLGDVETVLAYALS